jgi:hypothetical protein
VAASRRVVPYLLLGLLTGGAIIGLAVGLASAPTSDDVALQSAAVITTEASSLRFTADLPPAITTLSGRRLRLPGEQVSGLWQAPNRWQTTIKGGPNDGHSFTTVGSHTYIKNPGQRIGRLDSIPYSSSPFDVPYGFFGLPPLGSLTTAVDVVRHGDVYTFVIPNLDVPPQTIVYAPLSGAHYVPPVMVAHNVSGTAEVVGGYVVKCDFPNGVILGKQHFRPVAWSLSDFGTAPPVLIPKAGGI